MTFQLPPPPKQSSSAEENEQWLHRLWYFVTGGGTSSVNAILNSHVANFNNPHQTTLSQVIASEGGVGFSVANLSTLTNGSNADALHEHSHGALDNLDQDDHLQYHTDARALTWLGTRSTTDLAEGSNLYFTDERAQDAIGTILTDSASVDFTYNDPANTITATVIQAGIDHGSISGLADDDHTQYLNTTRHTAITGNPHSTNFTDLSDVNLTGSATGDIYYRDSSGDLVNLARPGSGTQYLTATSSTGPNWAFLPVSIPALSSVLATGNTTGGTNMVFSTTDQLQFRDANAYFSSPSSGNLDLTVTGTFQIAGTFNANSGMTVDLPAISSTVRGFSVAVAADPGIFFLRTATSAGDVVFKDSTGTYHTFGTLGSARVGDVTHTDGTRSMSFDASAGELSVTNGVNTLRMDAVNGRFEVGANNGATGSFTAGSGEVVTVTGGIITSIV